MINNKIISLVIVFFSLKFIFATPVSESEVNNIMNTFSKLCQEEKFSGAILIARYGKIEFQNACGYADRSFNVKNTLNTKFNLGSVGKLFTIVSIAQLIQNNKLYLDENVSNIIPNWLIMKYASYIKIEDLLTHSSGLENFMDDNRWKYGADSGLYNTTDEHKPLIQAEKLKFFPGESQLYSNSGYLVLGKVIEKVSNLTYKKYIINNIFNIAGMKKSGIYSLDQIVNNRAVGYYYSCDKTRTCTWKNNNFEAPYIGTSAGGSYSTIGDLFKFSQALYFNKLLNKKMTDKVLSTNIRVIPKERIFKKSLKIDGVKIYENMSKYGFAGNWNNFGFAVWNNPDLIGHTGGTTGAGALFMMAPKNRYTIIILSRFCAQK